MSAPAAATSTVQVPKTQSKRREACDKELERLHDLHGALTPDLILEEAKDEQSPLHSYFEWDDSVAAQKYRRQQAYDLLLAAKFVEVLVEQRGNRQVVVEKMTDHRVWLNAGRGTRKFMRRDEVLSEAEMRQQFIQRKLAELTSWCNSVSDVKELTKVRLTIEKLVAGF